MKIRRIDVRHSFNRGRRFQSMASKLLSVYESIIEYLFPRACFKAVCNNFQNQSRREAGSSIRCLHKQTANDMSNHKNLERDFQVRLRFFSHSMRKVSGTKVSTLKDVKI